MGDDSRYPFGGIGLRRRRGRYRHGPAPPRVGHQRGHQVSQVPLLEPVIFKEDPAPSISVLPGVGRLVVAGGPGGGRQRRRAPEGFP